MLTGTFVSPGGFVNAFPDDARVINVTNWSANPAQNVIPNDGIDDTARIQAILDQFDNDSDSAPPSKVLIFFPAGVYDVSDKLDSSTQAIYTRPKIIGESVDSTIFRLAPNSPGYGAGTNKSVLRVGLTSNTSFASYATDFTIEVGPGNPGAVGLSFAGHNYAAVERVRITASADSGAIGLLLGRDYASQNSGFFGVGPHLTRDIEIIGFDEGVRIRGDGAVGLERVTLNGQRVAGVYQATSGTPLGLRDVTSTQSGDVPVVIIDSASSAPFSANGSHFINSSGGGSTPAIKLSSSAIPKGTFQVHLKGVIQDGYGSMVEQNNVAIVTANSIGEWQQNPQRGTSSTDPTSTAFDQSYFSVDIGVPDSPVYVNHNFDTDYVAIGSGTNNAAVDNAAFAAALASGKPVLYARANGAASGTNANNTKLTGTHTIPSHVEAIDLFWQSIGPDTGLTWIIEGDASDPPLTIRRFEHAGSLNGQFTLIHRGTRTLIMEHVSGIQYVGEDGAGTVFMNNVLTRPVFGQGQKAYIRQLNTEGNGAEPFVQVNGAEVWIHNHKSEQDRPIYRVTGGGKLETYVTKSVNPDAQNPSKPISSWDTNGKYYLETIDGVASLAAVNTDSGYAAAWPDVIRETRNGVTETFRQPNPGTGIDGFKYGLIVANPANVSQPLATAVSSATAVDTSVTLSFANVAGETGYTIEYATNPAFSQNLGAITAPADATSAVVSGLEAETQYYFRIRAQNGSLYSPRSNPVVATTGESQPIPPVPPTALAATATSTSQVSLTWSDNSANETGFKLERATDNGFTQNLTLVAATAANATSFNDNGLEPETTYYYRVRATNSFGDSAYSDPASATTLALPAPFFFDDFEDDLPADEWELNTSGPWGVQTHQNRIAYRKSGTSNEANRITQEAWGQIGNDYVISSLVNIPNYTGSISVLARYTDNNNYYELRLNGQSGDGGWTLLERVAGVNTTLASGALSGANDYNPGQWATMRLSVQGSEIIASWQSAGSVTFTTLHTATNTALLTGRGGIRSAGVSGYFDNVDVVQLAPVMDPLAGDFNGDLSVDAADYTVWRDQLGLTVTPSAGADANGNGVVDAVDLLLWRSTFGNVAMASVATPADLEAAAVVDEPISTASTGTVSLVAGLLRVDTPSRGLSVVERAFESGIDDATSDLLLLLLAEPEGTLADDDDTSRFADSGLVEPEVLDETYDWPAFGTALDGTSVRG